MTMKHRLSIFIWAALGMMVGHGMAVSAGKLVSPAFAEDGADIVAARGFEMVDEQGRRQILIATAREGSPAIWMFDRNGKARLNLLIYEDGNAGVVLNDAEERAVQIFRTVGSRSAPVLVMKSEGRDRIVLGLDSQTQNPFLTTWDNAGAKNAVFGDH